MLPHGNRDSFLNALDVFIGRNAGGLLERTEKRSPRTESAPFRQRLKRIFGTVFGRDYRFKLQHPVFIYVVIITLLQVLVEKIRKRMRRRTHHKSQISNLQVGMDIRLLLIHHLVQQVAEAFAFFIAQLVRLILAAAFSLICRSSVLPSAEEGFSYLQHIPSPICGRSPLPSRADVKPHLPQIGEPSLLR